MRTAQLDCFRGAYFASPVAFLLAIKKRASAHRGVSRWRWISHQQRLERIAPQIVTGMTTRNGNAAVEQQAPSRVIERRLAGSLSSEQPRFAPGVVALDRHTGDSL